MGAKSYSLLRSLTTPDKPGNKTFVQLVKVMKDHLTPKPPQTMARFTFNSRTRQTSEGVNTYVAALRKL